MREFKPIFFVITAHDTCNNYLPTANSTNDITLRMASPIHLYVIFL